MRIVIALGVVAAGGLLWWLLSKTASGKNTGDPDTGGTGKGRPGSTLEDGTPHLPGLLKCFEVPDSFPRYATGAVSNDLLELVSSGKNRMGSNNGSEHRAVIQGFFKAIDVEPAAFVVNYFGLPRINEYLSAPEGAMPHDVVTKGSLRCSPLTTV